jgi:hypothetical protein
MRVRGGLGAFDEIEAFFDTLDPEFEAVQTPVHTDKVLLNGGQPGFDVPDVLTEPIDLLVDSAEIAEDKAFGFVRHELIMEQKRPSKQSPASRMAAMLARGAGKLPKVPRMAQKLGRYP